MWKGRTRLPLSVPGFLARGARPGPDEERCEEAVLVTFHLPGPAPLDAPALDLAALEMSLDRAVRAGRAGELEGVQPGPGRFTVLAYGADAERLWASLEPAVRPLPYRPAEVTLRYGPIGAPDRTIPL